VTRVAAFNRPARPGRLQGLWSDPFGGAGVPLRRRKDRGLYCFL